MKTANMMVMTTRRKSASGFGLIELMVAIVIAMVVSAGAIAVFGNMRGTFTAQDRMGQLQDSQRLALTMLTTTVQSAGYFYNVTGVKADAAFPVLPAASDNTDGTSWSLAGMSIVGKSGTGANSSDSLNVRFQTSGTDTLMDCMGQSFTSAKDYWVSSFAVNASNQLTCQVNKGTSVALIDNVYSMKVKYLVSRSSGYQYLDASDMAAADWTNAISARVTLSFVDVLNSKSGAIVALPNNTVQTIALMNR